MGNWYKEAYKTQRYTYIQMLSNISRPSIQHGKRVTIVSDISIRPPALRNGYYKSEY